MENNHYQVFYLDGLKTGVPEESAINSLCQIFGLTRERARKIIRRPQRAIKSDLNLEQAQKYHAALTRAGLEAEIRDLRPKPEPSPVNAADSSTQELGLVPIEETPFSGSSALVNDSQPPPPPMESEHPPPSDEDPLRTIPVQFNGQAFEYFRIWIVNLFLTIVTLGIYSAWAKVRNTQYFYGNTIIDGSRFHYTADPVVILKGRLIAVAFFILYALANEFLPILGLLFFVALLIIIPWVVVRALAFNARNSMYRNVRFNFTGRVGDAAKIFLLLPILIPLTLGLILPYLWYRQRQFVIGNSSYGTSAFRFHAGAGDYYRIFFMLLALLVGGGVAVAVVAAVGQMMVVPAALLGAPLMVLLYLWAIGYYMAATTNLQYNATTLSGNSFSMNLQTGRMAWLYFSNTLGILLSIGLLIPWAQVRLARYRAECLQLHVSGSLDKFVAEEQAHVSALGEQMGDVFDVGISAI